MYHDIKTVKGVVPICANCHSVRNDKGFWTQLEIFLDSTTELQLSHGICLTCMEKEFPEIYQDLLEEGALED